MAEYIMALDQGTTSSRCILFDHEGNMRSVAQKEFQQIYPEPGWVEHDPFEIWSSMLSVCTESMARIGATVADIAAIGITNQRETTIVWDASTGEPVYNAIVWQCRRTAPKVDSLIKQGYGDDIRKKTGLVPDAYFSATKIAWILDHVDGTRDRAKKGELLFGTVDTWLIWHLTGGKLHVTDRTNASRTMLYNIHDLTWDNDLLKMLDIPKAMLPEVKSSSEIYGYTDTLVLGGKIPIAGIAGDQQAALFGQCCFDKGDVKNTYGTGCFLLMNTGENAIHSGEGMITTIAATGRDSVQYALEGSVFVAGACVQWLRDSLRMVKSAAQTEESAAKVDDTEGVYLVPAFAGLGAPYWNSYARGVMVGMTRGFTKEHFIRSALESIAYQTVDVLRAMERDIKSSIRNLKVDGGASANDFLMQFQADILDVSVYRPSCIETTALGAAYLAGLAIGYYKDTDEIRSNWALQREFTSSIESGYREKLLKGWKRAVHCALAWADTEAGNE